MKNPLNRRILREFIKNKGRYISIFVLLTITISLLSSFFVAQKITKDSHQRLSDLGNVESGEIQLVNVGDNKEDEKIVEEVFKEFEVEYDEKFSMDLLEKNENSEKLYRVFKHRTKINKEQVTNGRLPEKDNEIAIVRTFSVNNNINIGDKIKIQNKEYNVVGIVVFPDYTTLLRKNSDMIMDIKNFTTAIITENEFNNLSKKNNVKKIFSYKYDDEKLSAKEKIDKLKNISKKFIEKGKIPVSAYIAEDNKPLSYFKADMDGDVPTMLTLLIIIYIVMAFVFEVIIKDTIKEEAEQIGTLLALGYSRFQIKSYYLKLPIYVTLISGVIGNIISYTYMKDKYLALYYRSYELLPPIIKFDMYAFLITTIIPIILMLTINYFEITRALKLNIVNFLRGEVTKDNSKQGIKIPNFKFLTRFRLRLFLKNKESYLVLLIGILVSNILLIYGLELKTIILDNYANATKNSIPFETQLMLKSDLNEKEQNNILKENEGTHLSSFTAYVLQIKNKKTNVNIFGVDLENEVFKKGITNRIENPQNVEEVEHKEDTSKEKNKEEKKDKDKIYGVYISKGLKERRKLKTGDVFELYNKYNGEYYKFRVLGYNDKYITSIALLMDHKTLNQMIDKSEKYFNGIYSNQELKINSGFIEQEINKEETEKAIQQFIKMFEVVIPVIIITAITIYFIVIYILTKNIIEKQSLSISLLKVLGYSEKTINKIYIRVSSIAIYVFMIILIPLEKFLVEHILEVSTSKLEGYIEPTIKMTAFVYVVLIGIVTYTVLKQILLRKINKIDLEEVLKVRK